jgi:hypothetical protein
MEEIISYGRDHLFHKVKIAKELRFEDLARYPASR